jgi:hypothetical protein
VLSARATVDVATAFQLMRRYARGSGRSLTTVAAEVVAGSLGADQLQEGAAGR